MASPTLKVFTDANFYSEINNSDIPAIVDFWAPWCGPCRQIAPIFEKVASLPEYADKIIFGKMNVDENTEIPGKMGILGIPTFKIYKKGQGGEDVVVVATKSGMMNEAALCAFIDTALAA